MNTLDRYLELIVDPTFADYERNRGSIRHAFLTAVAIYHAIDRVTAKPGKGGNLRKEWRSKCPEFGWIDIIAHHFKHVRSDDEKGLSGRPGIPVALALGFNEAGDEMDLRNIYFLLRDGVRFLHAEALALANAEPAGGG